MQEGPPKQKSRGGDKQPRSRSASPTGQREISAQPGHETLKSSPGVSYSCPPPIKIDNSAEATPPNPPSDIYPERTTSSAKVETSQLGSTAGHLETTQYPKAQDNGPLPSLATLGSGAVTSNAALQPPLRFVTTAGGDRPGLLSGLAYPGVLSTFTTPGNPSAAPWDRSQSLRYNPMYNVPAVHIPYNGYTGSITAGSHATNVLHPYSGNSPRPSAPINPAPPRHAAEPSLTFPKVDAEKEVVLLYGSRQEALDAAQKQLWSSPSPDPTIPTNDGARQFYVAMLYAAMRNEQGVLDTKSSKQIQDRWLRGDRTFYYTKMDVEKACWDMVDVAERIHTHGPATLSIWSNAAWRQITAENEMKFSERLKATATLLRLFKSRCEKIMNGVGMEESIAAPHAKFKEAARFYSIPEEAQAAALGLKRRGESGCQVIPQKRAFDKDAVINTNAPLTSPFMSNQKDSSKKAPTAVPEE